MHIDRIWRHLCFSCISAEGNEQVNNVETKSWKISLRKGGSLTYIALPGSQHSMSFCERERKPNYKTSIFENLEDSCEPRISLSWMCTFQPFYVRLALPVSNKQMFLKTMYMEASALAKKKPKLSDNHFCIAFALRKMNNGRPAKIAFLWRHKFPPGCDGRVSKFPIQSLLQVIWWRNEKARPKNFCAQASSLRHQITWLLSMEQVYNIAQITAQK